jgi:hypothetical protein
VLDYAAAERGGVADLLWGPLLGMRDELREVCTQCARAREHARRR